MARVMSQNTLQNSFNSQEVRAYAGRLLAVNFFARKCGGTIHHPWLERLTMSLASLD